MPSRITADPKSLSIRYRVLLCRDVNVAITQSASFARRPHDDGRERGSVPKSDVWVVARSINSSVTENECREGRRLPSSLNVVVVAPVFVVERRKIPFSIKRFAIPLSLVRLHLKIYGLSSKQPNDGRTTTVSMCTRAKSVRRIISFLQTDRNVVMESSSHNHKKTTFLLLHSSQNTSTYCVTNAIGNPRFPLGLDPFLSHHAGITDCR